MAISVGCYLVAILWIGLFGANASIFITAVLGAPMLFLSGQRRCRDAHKPQWVGALTQLPWWLFAISVSLSASVSWWLSLALIGVIASMLLAIYPSRSVGRFEYGYHGPVTLNNPKSKNLQRVEPSLNGEIDHSTVETYSAHSAADTASVSAQLQEVIEETPLNRKQWIFAGVGVLSLVLVGLLSSMIFSGEAETQAQQVEAPQPQAVSEPTETVSFRDGFKLSLQGNKLSMSWLGDDGASEVLWQLADAKGDRSCRELRFNNGTSYRPMKVTRLGDQYNSTQAEFTPLDTKAIIKDIARRGKVSLCGYTFSLKGSQADMSKNRAFRAYIE